MDFDKAISIDNSESDKLLKTFIYMNTVLILYILRVILSLTRCRFAKPSEEEKHAYTLASNCSIKKFTDFNTG